MLTEVCDYLYNYFDRGQRKIIGVITIEDGAITGVDSIQTGQYYRIVGSVFNNGVHRHGFEELTDETFNGAIWLMAIPKDFIDLVKDIEAWRDKYGGVDSPNMSPLSSESFAGVYNYSKSGSGASSITTWQSVFADRLRRFQKT